MRLLVDFRALEDAVRRMGAASLPVGLAIDVRSGIDPLEPIDIKLRDGIEIDDLSEVEAHPDTGLLTYRGRQVVLYIQDHSFRAESVVEQPQDGNKVHISDCQTLRSMKIAGRFERYVVTNNISGEFYITGQTMLGQSFEGTAELSVCKHCLQQLNYRGYNGNKRQVLEEFQWGDLFDEYSPQFRQLPSRRAGTFDGLYSSDWVQVSRRYKKLRNFVCEECGVDLHQREFHRLLHVHHIDGVKTNNDRSNLRSLCVLCHLEQPQHEHMQVSSKDRETVKTLRILQKSGQ